MNLEKETKFSERHTILKGYDLNPQISAHSKITELLLGSISLSCWKVSKIYLFIWMKVWYSETVSVSSSDA